MLKICKKAISSSQQFADRSDIAFTTRSDNRILRPTSEYWERGISRIHGYWTEFYVESEDFLVKIPPKISEVAVLLEPLSIIEKGLKQAEDIQKRLDIWQPKTPPFWEQETSDF